MDNAGQGAGFITTGNSPFARKIAIKEKVNVNAPIWTDIIILLHRLSWVLQVPVQLKTHNYCRQTRNMCMAIAIAKTKAGPTLIAVTLTVYKPDFTSEDGKLGRNM
jgi:hypothetical protein